MGATKEEAALPQIRVKNEHHRISPLTRSGTIEMGHLAAYGKMAFVGTLSHKEGKGCRTPGGLDDARRCADPSKAFLTLCPGKEFLKLWLCLLFVHDPPLGASCVWACTGLVAGLLHAPTRAHADGCCPPPIPYIHFAAPANSAADYTQLDNTSFNGNPNAVLMVTPNWNPGGIGGIYDNHPLGVFYSAPFWYIFHEDLTPIPNGAAFNVNLGTGFFVQTATSANSHANATFIDQSGLDGQPGAQLIITPNWNPGGRALGVYNNHRIGVSYNSLLRRWSIFNQDGASMPTGASFNVVWFPASTPFVLRHQATSANSFSDYTILDEPYSGSDDPSSFVWVTPDRIPSNIVGYNGVFEDHNLGVFYDGSHWCIFNQDHTPIPSGAIFFISIFFYHSSGG